MPAIPSIKETEKGFETEVPEFDSAKRWSWPGPGKIGEQIKRPKNKPILEWEQGIYYKSFTPFFEARAGKIAWTRNFLLKSLFDEEKILGFEGDPDDKSFVPTSKETLERAKQFFSPYLTVFSAGSYDLKILPGPNGSIDIHWKSAKKELLINIPADENEPALFYGDDYGKLSIEGKMDTRSLHSSVIMWLISS